ncbi:hypothetical protein ACFPYM_17625, partial [Methylobacterium hispanicum]
MRGLRIRSTGEKAFLYQGMARIVDAAHDLVRDRRGGRRAGARRRRSRARSQDRAGSASSEAGAHYCSGHRPARGRREVIRTMASTRAMIGACLGMTLAALAAD